MIKRVYPLINTLIAPALAGVSLLKKDLQKGAISRFMQKDFSASDTVSGVDKIWIHAASAGEVRLANLFAKEYLQTQSTDFLLTTNTESGRKTALAGPYKEVRYFPFDSHFSIKKIFVGFKPQAIVLVELELWPGLLLLAEKYDVPVFVINSRISNDSVAKLRRLNRAFDNILSYPHYLCRNDRDMDNLMKIQIGLERILVTGEMKIDLTLKSLKNESDNYDGRIMLAVSTHSEEEKIILEAYLKLKADFPDLKLLIAPRHQRRVGYVLKLAAKYGFASTSIGEYNVKDNDWADVLVEDRFGRMHKWFKVSNVAIVGGSFVNAGCHNVLEPVFYGLPVLVGPYHGHWSDWINALDDNGVLSTVKNSDDIVKIVAMILDNETELNASLITARASLMQQKGVTERNVKLIQETLKGGDPFGI